MLRPVPNARDERPDTCPLGECDGSGWLMLDDDANLARPCACRERRVRRAARRLGTGIPKRFRGVSFERKPICDLDPFVLRHVRQFVDRIDARLDAGDGLWFFGDVGTGKTSLAMVVTTNLGLDELREQLGERTVSRLGETCGEPIPIMGPDLRVVGGGP